MMGNLDNLNLGMGLRAKPSQFIRAQHAGLDGWSSLGQTGAGSKLPFGILGTLLLVFLVYKLTR